MVTPRVAFPTALPTGRRFERQLTVPGFGPEQQRLLRRATVLVAGVGGVGGAAATYLAAAGVGRLVLVHPGVLEEPDLNRQTLMRPDQIGSPRVVCAAETLSTHYPDVEVNTRQWELTHPELPELVAAADVVVDARHNFPERYLLNRLCVVAGVPLVVAAMNATEAFLLTVRPGSPCLRCLFAAGDPSWEPLGFPVLGAVAGTVGCLAAMEAIKIMTGFGRPTTGRMLHLDLWDMDLRTFRTHRDPGCPDCAGTETRHQHLRQHIRQRIENTEEA
ncbi:MAG: HesA/MoeB/ThiF family protein [Frankia sp.]|nr:HesA/MoeB/ThiF family protein [Frankia sp.]